MATRSDRRAREHDRPQGYAFGRGRDEPADGGRFATSARAWEHERSSGSRRGGEAYQRSPRVLSHGRPGSELEADWPDRGHANHPKRRGQRSSDVYGDWPGPEYEAIRIGREGFAVENERSGFGAEGTHAGKGPKGYTRSDERIREEVCEALTRDPYVDASDMEVRVDDCEVTLDGTAMSRRMKRDAEDIAHAISGVQQVHNRLRVARR